MHATSAAALSAAEKLSKLIQFKTISYNDESLFDENQFKGFLSELETLFPECHKTMKREVFNSFAVSYTWDGTNKNLKPAILIAHFDVVPIVNEAEWTHKPFSGDIDDGFVWGRGTIDIKNQLCAVMEACEKMIADGVKPERTIYLAWGGDEEVSGTRGAKVMAAEFEKRGIQFAFLMDEGGAVSPDQLSMVDNPIALIGVEEKGAVNLNLSCRGKTGHSSMPPAHTAIGILSEAVARIENNPFPAKLTVSTRGLFKAVAPHCKGIYKILFSNLNIFGGLLKRFLAADDTSNAMVRTSQSVTIFSGGFKENILPERAECTVNIRILPGETIESVKRRIVKIVNNPEIKIEVGTGFPPNEPILIRSLDTPYFNDVCESIKDVYPEAVPAPYMVLGGTDSKNYERVTDNIFRFSPMMLDRKEMAGMHGLNERISIENINNMVAFYDSIIRRSCLK